MPETERGTGEARCTWRELLLVLAIAAVAFAVYLARTDFHIFPRDDVMEEVIAARQLAAGEGFTSRTASPSMLTFLAEQDRLEKPWPNALRAPLPVMLIAFFSGIVSEPLAVALSSGIFFVVCVPLIYLLGFRLQGRPAAVLAATAFGVSHGGLYYAASGMTESSTMFVLVAIVLLLMRPLTWQNALLAGVAAGVGYLGRPTMSVWAVLILAYIVWRSWDCGARRIVIRAALFSVPFLIAFGWWGLQMKALAGEFGYSAQPDIVLRHDMDLYPGRTSSIVLEHWEPLEFILEHPEAVARKYAVMAQDIWPRLTDTGGLTLFVALFLAEFVVVASGGKPAGVRVLVYAMMAVTLLMIPLTAITFAGMGVSRYLDPLGPVAGAIGAAFAIDLVRRYGGSLRWAVLPLGLLVLLTAMPILLDLGVGRYHEGAAEELDRTAEVLRQAGDPDDVVASPFAALLTWASGMYSVRLPMDPVDFLRMHSEMVEVNWVHIRRHAPTNAAWTTAWEPIMEGEETLPGFEMYARTADGGVLLRRQRQE